MVSFGDASLILSDIRSSLALTHWSLPAAERINPGDLPARYTPDASAGETLEIEDDMMIGAIEQVRRAIESQRPRNGRLRGPLVGGLIVALVIGAALLLPDALTRHTAAAVPQATREAIGAMVLKDLTRITGPACSSRNGDRALSKLWGQIAGKRPGGLTVLPQGFAAAAHLPGGRIILQRDVIERQDSEDVAAGYVLAEQVRAESVDPLLPLLEHAGLVATFRLLTTGELPAAAVRGYGEVLLSTPVRDPDPQALLARFAEARVSATPYARAVDPGGQRTQALIDGDPFKSAPPQPLLTDSEWVGLQGICTD